MKLPHNAAGNDRTDKMTHGTPVLIFDGDDTLWFTMPLYAKAKNEFFQAMKDLGFDSNSVEALFERLDSKNVRRFGFTRKRFYVSMLETYRACIRKSGNKADHAFEKRIWRIAFSVFQEKPTLANFARETLGHLQKRYRLLLLTKGERPVQRERLRVSGLENFFERVIIVPHKTESVFDRVLEKYNCPREATCSISNSIRSDIKPALMARLKSHW